MKRRSLLPSKLLRTEGPKREVDTRCVGCGSPVRVGFCYTGSVISGMAFKTINGTEMTPIKGIIERTIGHHPNSHTESSVIGGEMIRTEKKIGFYKRNKGNICDICAANYHTICDSSGKKHQIVMTNPRPGYIGMTAIPTI